MNKFYATALILMLAVGATKAQTNLFDPADVDANGWIWFDTQAKIDKYIGQSDNENAKYNENGKIIQMVSAGFGDYVDTEVSPDFKGTGTDGVLETTGAHVGAIKTAPSSANMTANGGGFIVKMPSCISFNVCVSADSKMYVRLLGTTVADKITSDYTIASAKFTTVFKPLASAGIFTWSDMEQLNTGFEPIFKLASTSTMYAYFQSLTKNNIYIHGMKILTAQPSGVNDVNVDTQKVLFDGKNILLLDKASIKLYDAQGNLMRETVNSSLSVADITKGVYIAHVTFAGNQNITKKIIIR